MSAIATGVYYVTNVAIIKYFCLNLTGWEELYIVNDSYSMDIFRDN